MCCCFFSNSLECGNPQNMAWHTQVLCETPLLSLPRAGEADLAVPPGSAALRAGLRDFSREMPCC